MLLLASQDETIFLLKAGPQIGRHAGDLFKLQGGIGRNRLVPFNDLVDRLRGTTHTPRHVHLAHPQLVDDFSEILAGGDSEIRVQTWISSHNAYSPPRYEQSPV